MDVCIVNQEGELLVHRNLPASPAPFLKAVAPYRTELVVCVECIFPWYWRADRCAHAGSPLVLGPARYRKAMPGGKAKNDKIDAQKIAGLLRGGRLPPAYGSPAAMRATRELRRRRSHLVRQRAERLTPVHPPNRQDTLPAIGTKIADKPNRAGVAERWAAPAGPKSLAVALALLDDYDQRLRDVELAIVQTAQQHEATPLSLLQPVPGLGKLLSLVLLSELPDLARFPRVQAFVSSCRLGTGAKEAAGKRDGTAGTKMGHASLKGAFSEAAVLLLRRNPAGHTSLAR